MVFIFECDRRERCLEVEYGSTVSVTQLEFAVITASNTTIPLNTRSLAISWLEWKVSIGTA